MIPRSAIVALCSFGLLLGLATACLAPATPDPPDQPEQQTLLDAHNADRARHCTPALTWSREVAASAQQWANRCVFDHDYNGQLGENLAWGTQLSAREAVQLWYEEINQYNYASPGFGPAGHFTQVVWRDSRQLGCGKATCHGEVFWVCRYSPAGNFEGELPRMYRACADNVGPKVRKVVSAAIVDFR